MGKKRRRNLSAILNYSSTEIFFAGLHLSYSYGFMDNIQRKQE